jgi:hypothetical protein
LWQIVLQKSAIGEGLIGIQQDVEASLSPVQRRDLLDGFISLCRHNALSG